MCDQVKKWPGSLLTSGLKTKCFYFAYYFLLYVGGGGYCITFMNQNMFMFLRHLGFLSFSDDNKDRLYYWWRE